MSNIDATQWNQYIKTPARMSPPVKLDRILAQRIEAFIRAKKIQEIRTTQQK